MLHIGGKDSARREQRKEKPQDFTFFAEPQPMLWKDSARREQRKESRRILFSLPSRSLSSRSKVVQGESKEKKSRRILFSLPSRSLSSRSKVVQGESKEKKSRRILFSLPSRSLSSQSKVVQGESPLGPSQPCGHKKRDTTVSQPC
ncbi:hypothetical protein MR642_03590 [bacterium]|nr:hypothetical protein [bacterium]